MRERADYQFYPVAKSQIENEDFRKLPPTGKLYYWYLSNEFSRYTSEFGEYYRSDIWFAKALGVEVITIRKIRRNLEKIGFIKTIPGHKNKYGRPVATKYLEVKWARAEELEEGDSFSRNRRYSLEMLLRKLRDGIFKAQDVVTYVYLEYFRDVYSLKGDMYEFFVTKKDLRHATNVKKAVACVHDLYEQFEYSGGSRLFECEEEYHRFVFNDWTIPAEPSVEEKSNSYAKYEEDIKRRIEYEKEKEEEKRKAALREKAAAEGTVYFAEDLTEFFREKYKEFHQTKTASLDWNQQTNLEQLGIKHKPEFVAGMIEFYFTVSEVPNPTGATKRTLGRFVHGFDLLVEQAEGLVNNEK